MPDNSTIASDRTKPLMGPTTKLAKKRKPVRKAAKKTAARKTTKRKAPRRTAKKRK